MKFSFYPKLLVRIPAKPFSDFSPLDLEKVLLDVDFQQALLLASPHLYSELMKRGFAYEFLNTEHRMAVYKYYNRMCHRTTPFGSFASVSLINWSSLNQRMLRENGQLLVTFADFGQIDPIPLWTKDSLIYLNPSIYPLGNQFRYLFRQTCDGKRAIFKIMKIYKSRLLAKLLKRFEKPIDYESVISFLKKDLLQEDGPVLITKLIKAQILYHSALPRITGHFLHGKLDPSATMKETYTIAYHKQKGSLSSSYQKEILEAFEILDRLAIAHQENTLSDFAAKFAKRFEVQEIQLLRALDPQFGISYLGTEKSDGQDANLRCRKDQQSLKGNWTAVSAMLLQKLSDLSPGNQGVIYFSEDDISRLPASDKVRHFPPSLWVMFRQAGDHLYIENVGGNSAISIAGRFSHHQEIQEELQAIAALEQARNAEVVFAEIAAMDNSVTDNINSRGHLRDFEIPVLVHSDMPQEQIISLNDLYIKVVDGRVILCSKRLNRMVIPRLASAYNYKLSNLPLLRFLGDLQYQDLKCDFSFDPEFYLAGLKYYPRVMFKNIILSPAKWLWDENTINDFKDPDNGLSNFYHMASVSRLARFFALTKHDRQLVFDLNCEESIKYFLHIVRNESQIKLTEFYLPGDNAKIFDVKGKAHFGQFVAFLINDDEVYRGKITEQPNVVKNVKSVFFPGEEWLYFKIYAHQETLNNLLAGGSFGKILSRFRKMEAINCWFFVRYADPECHLRVRLKVNTYFVAQITAEVNHLIKKQLKNGLVTDFTIATYQAELERYGFAGMEEVEKIFELSSDAILDFCKIRNTFYDQVCFAFCSVVEVLSVMLPTLNERLAFVGIMHENMAKTVSRQVQLDEYYRRQKYQLECAVNDLEKYYGLRVARKIRELGKKCKAIEVVKRASSVERYYQFVSDLIHMHLNRLNATGSAEFEMNVYYFLTKYYRSLKGREKQLFVNVV